MIDRSLADFGGANRKWTTVPAGVGSNSIVDTNFTGPIGVPPDEAVADLFEPYQIAFAIEVDGAEVGSLQVAEEDEPDYRHAGIDLFLAPDYQGRGLGPEAINLVARYLFEVRGHHRLTIDPAAENLRAIHAYERVGFRPVGIMRQYERGRDGRWHDGLLMDLLVGELREP
jgi:aminoglycoside 6'-N-acetyltransferase